MRAEHCENPEATEAEYNVLAQRSDILKDILEAASNGAMESDSVQNCIQENWSRPQGDTTLDELIRSTYDQVKQKK